jgi:hypothetical protein
MSTVGMMSPNLATIFSLEGGKKWIIRLGRKGISRTGSGAPTARGLKKSLALRTMRGYAFLTPFGKPRDEKVARKMTDQIPRGNLPAYS